MTAAGQRRPAGYLLLEVIIALTVFSLVAVGLAQALNSSIGSANFLRREAEIRRGLSSVIAEARAMPKREQMTFEKADEVLGVKYRTSLEELEFVNVDRERVGGLYLLKASAKYTVDGKEVEDGAEVYVYRP